MEMVRCSSHKRCPQARWGSFNLVEASRTLLAAALRDPLNQRFVLLSESCVPLYSPQVVYMQLLSEQGSRVDACGRTVREGWRGLEGSGTRGSELSLK